VTNPLQYVLYMPLNVLEVRRSSNLHFALSRMFRCGADISRNNEIVVSAIECLWCDYVETPFGNTWYKKVHISIPKQII
jgi:hypothetical protein